MIDLVDRSTHQLQYDAVQLAQLPSKWRCRGSDPFRQARSLGGIKVTTPEACLRIRDAVSLEDVQAILMSLPPDVVVAGLDGEPVLRYTPPEGEVAPAVAEAAALRLLRQARVSGARVSVADGVLRVTFKNPELDNERYAHLRWHLGRVTGRAIEYDVVGQRRKRPNLRAVLASILPQHCRIGTLDASPAGAGVVASIDGLLPTELAAVASEFRDECGLSLELRGQMSLF